MNYRHRLSNTRLYRIYNNMINRCTNPTKHNYVNYGGKGIKVNDSWSTNILNFWEWAVQNGYSDELTLERIDNSENYEPSNCEWILLSEQYQNRDSNIMITLNGKTNHLKGWSRHFKVNYNTLKRLHHEGYSLIDGVNKIKGDR